MSSSNNYLCNARDFRVDTLTVITSGTARAYDKAFDYLHDNIAVEAVHNAEQRHDPLGLQTEALEAVQQDIFSWIIDGDEGDDAGPKKIMWLLGEASTGKTTISSSIADTCDELGLLAGSFFFSASAGSSAKTRSKRYLAATLVFHLILQLDDEHPLRRGVLAAIQRDPAIFRRRLKDQFKVLLVKPFIDAQGQIDLSSLPKVFVIDGLSEVEGAGSRHPELSSQEAQKDQEDILSTLLYAVNCDAFPFRFIVTSRPERVVQNFFSTHALGLSRQVVLDQPIPRPVPDISSIVNTQVAEIRRQHNLAPSWAPEIVIKKLTAIQHGEARDSAKPLAASTRVTGTVTEDCVRYRRGPYTSCEAVGMYHRSTPPITIVGRVQGQVVHGWTWWDKMDNGFYISDYFVDWAGDPPTVC